MKYKNREVEIEKRENKEREAEEKEFPNCLSPCSNEFSRHQPKNAI